MSRSIQFPFDIITSGRFTPRQLQLRHDASSRETTPEIETLIAVEWERQTKAAQHTDRLLFNGDMLRYVAHRLIPGPDAADTIFELTVGPTCYRDFVGTNLYNGHRVAELGWHRFSNPVGTTATLLTADGKICYGRRSHRVSFHADHVHTFGGALEARDRGADGQIDVFTSLLRELHEELALRPGDIDGLCCTGLIRDRQIHQPELLFEGRVGLTAAGLVGRWEGAEARDEHRELVFLEDRPEAVVPFIGACGAIAPVAVGALMLHGLSIWGEGWFAGAEAGLGGVGGEGPTEPHGS